VAFLFLWRGFKDLSLIFSLQKRDEEILNVLGDFTHFLVIDNKNVALAQRHSRGKMVLDYMQNDDLRDSYVYVCVCVTGLFLSR